MRIHCHITGLSKKSEFLHQRDDGKSIPQQTIIIFHLIISSSLTKVEVDRILVFAGQRVDLIGQCEYVTHILTTGLAQSHLCLILTMGLQDSLDNAVVY